MSAAGKRAAGKKKSVVVQFRKDINRKAKQKVLGGELRKALDTLRRQASELGDVELRYLERGLAMTVGDARRWSCNEIGALFGVLKMIVYRIQSKNSAVLVNGLDGTMAKIAMIKTSKAKCYEHMDTNEVRSNAPLEALIANLGGSSVESPDITPEATVQKRPVRVQAGTLLSAENNNFPATPAVQVADSAPENAVRVADSAPDNTSSPASPVPLEDITRSSDDESDEDGTLPGDLKGVESTLSGELDTQEVAEILFELPSSQRSM